MQQTVLDAVLNQARMDQIKGTIPGYFLDELSTRAGVQRILVFGCGISYLPDLIAQYYREAQITAYDTNRAKIELNKKSILLQKRVHYTTDRPSEKFDTVIAHAVLHENPELLTRAAVEFLKQGGHIGVMDYDMKGMKKDEFFSKWGNQSQERAERRRLGDDESYRMHTSFGLAECVKLMDTQGIEEVFSLGSLTGGTGVIKTTTHFIYIGRKPHNL